MRCDFCGEEIEGQPFYKDGMSFCSLECSDAMEGGEALPFGDELLDDPDDEEEEDFESPVEEEEDDEDEKDTDDVAISDEYIDSDFLDDEQRY